MERHTAARPASKLPNVTLPNNKITHGLVVSYSSITHHRRCANCGQFALQR